jgi:hypothetical protein
MLYSPSSRLRRWRAHHAERKAFSRVMVHHVAYRPVHLAWILLVTAA